jgi:hypothetical protein
MKNQFIGSNSCLTQNLNRGQTMAGVERERFASGFGGSST